MIPPYSRSVTAAPNTDRDSRPRRSSPFRYRIPAVRPRSPMANICQGVQGPWLKSMLDPSMVTAPTKKPASPPNATPERITMAATGLKPGRAKKAARPRESFPPGPVWLRRKPDSMRTTFLYT